MSIGLVRDLLRPELGAEAGSFTAASVLGWSMDWDNFRDEYPWVAGGREDWQHRLALALIRSFDG